MQRVPTPCARGNMPVSVPNTLAGVPWLNPNIGKRSASLTQERDKPLQIGSETRHATNSEAGVSGVADEKPRRIDRWTGFCSGANQHDSDPLQGPFSDHCGVVRRANEFMGATRRYQLDDERSSTGAPDRVRTGILHPRTSARVHRMGCQRVDR